MIFRKLWVFPGRITRGLPAEMQKLEDFEFYDGHEEVTSLPSNFKLIAEQEDGTFIYGNHTYGRSIKWEFVPFYGSIWLGSTKNLEVQRQVGIILNIIKEVK